MFFVNCISLIILTMQLRPLLAEGGKNSVANDCSLVIEDPGEGSYQKLTPSSKYVVYNSVSEADDGSPKFNWADAAQICGKFNDLEQAEVQHVYDLKSLEKIILEPVWLGLNDLDNSGFFRHASGDQMQFQTFKGTRNGPCVTLSPMQGHLIMEAVGCDSAVAGVLCQFKRGTHCYLQSAEETANIKDQADPSAPELGPLGVGNDYFVSKVQKSFTNAQEVCMRYGMQLIKMDDPVLFQELADQIKKHSEEFRLHPYTQFWTSGQFSKEGSEAHLFWKIGDDQWQKDTNVIPRSLIDELDGEKGAVNSHCLDISFEDSELSKPGNYQPNWRASDCLIPKNFICEKNVPAIPIQAVMAAGPASNDSNEAEGAIKGRSLTGEETPKKSQCHAEKRNPVKFETDITKPFSLDEVIKFMKFSVEHDLKSGLTPYEMKDEIKWKETVIDLIFQIAKKTVENDYVDHGIFNVAQVINLMYQNVVANGSDTVRVQVWKNKFIPYLKDCLKVTGPLPLVGTGFEIQALLIENGEEKQDRPINVLKELADDIGNLDSAIDILWFAFSLSLATCYNIPTDKTSFASDYHVAFVKDFISKVHNKWIMDAYDKNNTAAVTKNLGAWAFGDVDFHLSMRNLRYLVTAAYISNQMYHYQLVRPIDMTSVLQTMAVPRENYFLPDQTLY